MKHLYKKSLFIFRRDLRLHDNTALNAALKQSEIVIPCFIVDPVQVSKKNNYRSLNCMQFMVESLKDLKEQLHEQRGRLFIFQGNPAEVVKKLIKAEDIAAIFFNRDYTPYSTERDTTIQKVAAAHDCPVLVYDDALLNAPEKVLTVARKPYTVFTPYYRRAVKIAVAAPQKLVAGTFCKRTIAFEYKSAFTKLIKNTNKKLYEQGGRNHALKILRNIKKFTQYLQQRDFPALKTTALSAHNKFGTCSIREEYHAMVKALGIKHALVRQLYWRDFFTHAAFNFPRIFGHAFQKKYEHVSWQNNKSHFKQWCDGTTGFPIVDAGMRQLNTTGYMHNRVRMIVASFLTKDLHIDWRWGERYFAQQLVDYDPAVNNGSWQWAASTGCDAQPYFRIFNSWLQQKKFDPECVYIKEWIPELRSADIKIIHRWDKPNVPAIKSYPRPIVDHAVEAKKAIAAFKGAR